MKDKRFESRYLVLKHADVKQYLTRDQREAMEDLTDIVVLGRVAEGKGVTEGIFIANDWPEYQSASAALYNRISGKDIYKGHPNLADMISTHVDSLIRILERVAAEDVEEDTGYLNHEIRALRDIKAAIEAEKSNAL